jgi:hypothetical protein
MSPEAMSSPPPLREPDELPELRLLLLKLLLPELRLLLLELRLLLLEP